MYKGTNLEEAAARLKELNNLLPTAEEATDRIKKALKRLSEQSEKPEEDLKDLGVIPLDAG